MSRKPCFSAIAAVFLAVTVFVGSAEALALKGAAGFTNQRTGQQTLALTYDTGLMEFRSWTGALLTSRTGLGTITAIDSYRSRTASTPRLFVGSSDGTLRIINPTAITSDLKRIKLPGSITYIWTWEKYVWVATKDALGKGMLYLLDNATLATVKSRGFVGTIKFITDVEWYVSNQWGEGVAVASTDGGGTVSIVRIVYTNNVVSGLSVRTSRGNLGTINGLGAADIDDDGNSEIIVSSTSNSGCIIMLRASSLATSIGLTKSLGTPGLVDISNNVDIYGMPMITLALANGYVRTFDVNDDGDGTFTIAGFSQRSGFGRVVALRYDEIYGTGCDLVTLVSTDNTKAAFHVTGESVTTDLTIFRVAQ